MGRAAAILMFAVVLATALRGTGESSLSDRRIFEDFEYGPLWVAGKMGFFDKEGLEVQIVIMRGSPMTIQALAADSIYVANAAVDGSSAPMRREPILRWSAA